MLTLLARKQFTKIPSSIPYLSLFLHCGPLSAVAVVLVLRQRIHLGAHRHLFVLIVQFALPVGL